MRRAALAAAAAVAAAASGCAEGREATPDLVNGKALFNQKCASCHVLERAGAAGKIGPDLDQAFGPSRRDGLGAGTIQGIVQEQIANVRRGSKMPANLVRGDDARDVAAYVAAVAGVPGKDRGALETAGLAGATDGRQIFTAAGCGGCHVLPAAGGTGTSGPDLTRMKPDARYITESILEPDAVIAKGFTPGQMPADFGQRLRPNQVKALVDYLVKTSRGG